MEQIARKKFPGRTPEEIAGIAGLLRMGVPVRVINCLLGAGISTPDQLAGSAERTLLRIPGIGHTAVEDIRVTLWQDGLVLGREEDEELIQLMREETAALFALYAARSAHAQALSKLQSRRRQIANERAR